MTSFTQDDPRCKLVLDRLAEAKRQMKRRGTKLLMEGRAGWRTIVVTQPKPEARVTLIRKVKT